MLHWLGQSKRVLIVSTKMGKANAKLQEHSIDPLLHLNCILDLSFFGSHPGKHDSCRLLIKSLSELSNLILANILMTNGRYSRSDRIIRPLIGDYRLKVPSLHS